VPGKCKVTPKLSATQYAVGADAQTDEMGRALGLSEPVYFQ